LGNFGVRIGNLCDRKARCFSGSQMTTVVYYSDHPNIVIDAHSLVEQELLTLPEHLSSAPGFSGFVLFDLQVSVYYLIDRCLPFCAFSFWHCVACPSSTYEFWLHLWYLQTLLHMNSTLIGGEYPIFIYIYIISCY